MKITLYTYNILESGAVTISGTADTGFPVSRLYDRGISLYWKETVTEAKDVTIDQGTISKGVDILIIEKHNFNGKDMQWQYSSDNFASDVNDAVTDWTQSDNLQIVKTLSTPIIARYWRVTVSSITDPLCSEIYMSKGSGFDVSGSLAPIFNEMANVEWVKTLGGLERSTKFGDKKKVKEYNFALDSNDLIIFKDSMTNLDEYSKPFYLKDTDDSYSMYRLQSVPGESPNSVNTITQVSLYLIEIL